MDNNLLEEAEKMKKRTKQNEFFIDNNIFVEKKNETNEERKKQTLYRIVSENRPVLPYSRKKDFNSQMRKVNQQQQQQ